MMSELKTVLDMRARHRAQQLGPQASERKGADMEGQADTGVVTPQAGPSNADDVQGMCMRGQENGILTLKDSDERRAVHTEGQADGLVVLPAGEFDVYGGCMPGQENGEVVPQDRNGAYTDGPHAEESGAADDVSAQTDEVGRIGNDVREVSMGGKKNGEAMPQDKKNAGECDSVESNNTGIDGAGPAWQACEGDDERGLDKYPSVSGSLDSSTEEPRVLLNRGALEALLQVRYGTMDH